MYVPVYGNMTIQAAPCSKAQISHVSGVAVCIAKLKAHTDLDRTAWICTQRNYFMSSYVYALKVYRTIHKPISTFGCETCSKQQTDRLQNAQTRQRSCAERFRCTKTLERSKT